VGLSRAPTRNMPTKQHERAVRRSLRRPTWSTTADPARQLEPKFCRGGLGMMAVQGWEEGEGKVESKEYIGIHGWKARGGPTSDSTHHGRNAVDEVELTLSVPVGDASETKEDRQEVYQYQQSSNLNLQVIRPFPAS
jgi:hypothetical protein